VVSPDAAFKMTVQFVVSNRAIRTSPNGWFRDGSLRLVVKSWEIVGRDRVPVKEREE
jgi:hypothetical protein